MDNSFQVRLTERTEQIKLTYSIGELITDSIKLFDKQYSEKVPDRVHWIARDSFLVLLKGMERPELQNFINSKSSPINNDVKNIPIPGTKHFLSKEDALVIFGTAMVSDELDEGSQFAKGHPSAHVFPVALITAIEKRSSFKEFIKAFTIGYEVAARLGYASNVPSNMHPHGTWGLIGGAVSSSILKELPEQKIINSALLASSFPIVTSWQSAITGMNVRNLYCGLSCLNSYNAVTYEEYGFESNQNIFDDIWGNLLSKDYDVLKLKENLFAPLLAEKNYFKVYPSCRFTHSSIDAFNNVMKDHKIDSQHIDKVIVETYDLAARLVNPSPSNYLSAKFSIPYIIAVSILGIPLFQCFSREILESEEVRRIAEKIEVREDVALTNLLPDKRASRVTIHLNNGDTHSALVEAATGEFNLKFPEKEMMEKFESIIQDVFTHEEAKVKQDILEAVFTLEKTSSIKEWLESFNRRFGYEGKYRTN